MNVKELSLTVLFKIKFLYKILVFFDFVCRYRRLPKSIALTDKRDLIRINGYLFGFYSNFWMHGETPVEDIKWTER
ncbi:hypothetical protein OK18_14595 [Chryseobacterium gallinarum]|uniref:Uncharacterized protein n=1 Tax=Chryseobacterium gallinarum TaxID=1324352 RepID=A0A0G3M9G3_CHRGL|nr:hypothetical protein [Chryseobacterium gallinarum]AKK73667.1 hypothetical protein OK18_14595 [Chryseobacterium gallinarum]